MKKIFKIILLSSILTLVGANIYAKETINIWAPNNEIQPYIDHFKKSHPEVEITLTVLGTGYANKIKNVLRTRRGVPDIFAAELQFFKQYIDTNLLLALHPTNTDAIPKYIQNLVTDSKGQIKAVSYQSTPGGFFYRRSLAKQYFQTDDPQKIEEMLKDWDSFLNIARIIDEKSDHNTKITMGYEPIYRIFEASKIKPYIDKSGKFSIDDNIVKYISFYKKLADDKLIYQARMWSDTWFNALKNKKVFGVFLPTWGLKYNLMSGVPKSSGDWALTNAINPYFWGGTFYGVYSKSKKKKIASEFVKSLGYDTEASIYYGKQTGDFPSNIEAQKILSKTIKSEFLNNQNHFNVFIKQAKNIKIENVNAISKYDFEVLVQLVELVRQHVEGKITKDDVLKKLKKEMIINHPEINIH